MNRVIFVNRFFAPDHSATSQIVSDLAFQLASSSDPAGSMRVCAITSQQRYDNPKEKLPSREVVHGVCIHRVSSTHFGRSSLIGRGIDYLSFYRSIWQALMTMTDMGDIIVAKTDPPLLSILAMRAAKKRGALLINWLQDLYPDVAIELGVPFLKGPFGDRLSKLRDASLKAAAANVVIGERMADRLRSRGIPRDRIHVIPNWTDESHVQPVQHADNPLRRGWGLEGKFVIGYSGNLGRAHEFETMLEASQRLKDRGNIVFLYIGGGHRLNELAAEVKKRGLDAMYRFQPYQDLKVLHYALGVADVHWVSLKPELEGLLFPSKFYGIAAAGRPIVAVASRTGEIAELVRKHECGFAIEPGDVSGAVQILLDLSDDPQRVDAMGIRARAMLEECFTRRHAYDKWRTLLQSLDSVVKVRSTLEAAPA